MTHDQWYYGTVTLYGTYFLLIIDQSITKLDGIDNKCLSSLFS